MAKKIKFEFKINCLLIYTVFLFSFLFLNFSFVNAQTSSDWYMAGANPQRTSWVASTTENKTEIKESLKVLWYKPFESYILPRVQIVAANDLLYISAANGLYAIDASTGEEKWVYATSMPLGHSPTVVGNVAYVAGYDHKLHKINALTGQGIWTFEAQQGFATNPLVVGNTVYLGNRDGWFYAVNASTGNLVWKYQTQGPILFSAAEKDGTIFFASNNSYAYALNANNGNLLWKSEKLPGQGFHSFWPVVFGDWVIFAGSNNYRQQGYSNLENQSIGSHLHGLELGDIYPNRTLDAKGMLVGPIGQELGNWVAGTPTIDTSRPNTTPNGNTTPIIEYYEQPSAQELIDDPFGFTRFFHKPWRRSYFVLNRTTGKEYTTDLDQDGKKEYAPILWYATHSGNRYPPLVGADNVLYQPNNYRSNVYIAGGHLSGWQFGTQYISIISSDWGATDEPIAYSSGGSVVYWSNCCDREGSAIDLSKPNLKFFNNYNNSTGYGGTTDGTREWSYYGYNLNTLVPNYFSSTSFPLSSVYTSGHKAIVFGNINGIYPGHGDQSPLIPYKGKVYKNNSNVIMAFASNTDTSKVPLPISLKRQSNYSSTIPSKELLKQKLATEIQKIINSGHLRPGWHSTGMSDSALSDCTDNLQDYWHSSAETIAVLLQALPHLSSSLQDQVKQYLQQEMTDYPPYKYDHIGWSGEAREIYEMPPEASYYISTHLSPQTVNYAYARVGWKINPYGFYSLWQYAKEVGGAEQLFGKAKSNTSFMESFNNIPAEDFLLQKPWVHNAYLAGYLGYLELEKLAGLPETIAVRQQYDRLLTLRASSFTKDYPLILPNAQCHVLRVSGNFMFMTTELAQYLHDHALDAINAQMIEINHNASYWFVTKSETTFGEGALENVYNYHSVFQAKAKILHEPYEELARYIDIPAFERGDLYYIDNLVAAIEAPSEGETSCDGNLNTDNVVNLGDLSIVLSNWGNSGTGDLNNDQVVNLADIALVLSHWGVCP